MAQTHLSILRDLPVKLIVARGRRTPQPGAVLNLNGRCASAHLALASKRTTPTRRSAEAASWRLVALIILGLIGIAESAIIAARTFTQPVVAAARRSATLVVDSAPQGLPIFVNGVARGTTPARLTVGAGSQVVELRGPGTPRVVPVRLAPGEKASLFLDMPAAPLTGRLLVRSEPEGARVTVDGVDRGRTPVSVDRLGAGEHDVTLEGPNGAVRQRVVVEPGATASLVVPLPEAAGPASGWLAVTAPFDMDIMEGKRVIGTTATGRIPLAAGHHELEIVSTALGYRTRQTVDVKPGRVAAFTVELPAGTLFLNATPWAEVWIDGKRIGETPLGNVEASLGPHEVVFRHPELGDKTHAVMVTAGGPTRVSIDMK